MLISYIENGIIEYPLQKKQVKLGKIIEKNKE